MCFFIEFSNWRILGLLLFEIGVIFNWWLILINFCKFRMLVVLWMWWIYWWKVLLLLVFSVWNVVGRFLCVLCWKVMRIFCISCRLFVVLFFRVLILRWWYWGAICVIWCNWFKCVFSIFRVNGLNKYKFML